MAIFGPKPWVNPLKKCQFSAFLTSGFFRSGISFKTFSRPILPKKNKKMENWPFLDQSHGLTPVEKLQVFDFLNFLFL